jgi:release factor glutamine methyltransferase
MFAMMTIKELHKRFSIELVGIYGKGESDAIINIIFEKFVNAKRFQIITNDDVEAEKITEEKLLHVLYQLKSHAPVQHLTGEAIFYDLRFLVNENVLIPRPETEELVSHAITFLKLCKVKTVLDIGSGSGCIPVALKKNVTDAEIFSVDISMPALKTAKENAALNNVQVNFLQADFLSETGWKDFGKYDMIISNPPYIPLNEKDTIDKNVTMYEPHIALFVPQNDPLIFYKKIAVFADEHLNKNGKIFLETHQDLAKETASVFIEKNYEAIILQDMFGKERMVIVSKKD